MDVILNERWLYNMPRQHDGTNLTGRNLIKLRLNAGKSRELFVKLCEENGLRIKESEIEGIEENKRMVYDYELVVFAKVLGVSIDDLFAA